MRLLTWAALVGLAGVAVASGRPVVAVSLGGVKALLVGFEFMELRHAHRLHLAVFSAGIVALTALLAFLVTR